MQKYSSKSLQHIQKHPHGKDSVLFFYLHLTVVFSYDVFHVAKSQTMQVAVFFCCEKFCPLLSENSAAAVFDVDSQHPFFFPDGD